MAGEGCRWPEGKQSSDIISFSSLLSVFILNLVYGEFKLEMIGKLGYMWLCNGGGLTPSRTAKSQ